MVVLELMNDRWPTVQRADAVNQHPHFDSASHGPAQRIHECRAGLSPIENVGRERDALRGGINSCDHGRVGLVAVEQGFDATPTHEWLTGHRADEACDRLERPRRVAGEDVCGDLRRPCTNGLGPVFVVERRMPAHRADLTGDTIHAEQHVQQRAEHRSQPHQPHPPDRRPDVVLGQDDVRRDADREQDVRDGEERRDHDSLVVSVRAVSLRMLARLDIPAPDGASRWLSGAQSGCRSIA